MSLPTNVGPGTRALSRTSKREYTTLRIGLITACVVALALLGLVGVVSYRWILQVREDQRWIVHTHLVVEKLDDVLVHLISAGTDQRTYVLTGEQSHLSSYKADLDSLRDDLNQVGHLTADNPGHQQALQQLRPLVSTVLSEFREELTLGGKKSRKADIAVVPAPCLHALQCPPSEISCRQESALPETQKALLKLAV